MADIRLETVTDAAALGARWRALEAVSDGGFFRSWSYLGTLLPLLRAPRLLAVREHGRDVALGLFNRRGGRLYLHEAGDAALDRLYVEHNGLLVRRGADGVLADALAVALREGALVLSGVDAAHLAAAAAAGAVERRKTDRAPSAALGGSVLAGLSANARAQVRRAMRLYGPGLAIARADGTAEALRFFDRLVALHQARWRARGEPGAFADPAILRFHGALIREAAPRGEAALLRVGTGAREIGFLYHFEHGSRVFCYQSGFVAEADARLKPGLVCHVLAMADARARGLTEYDFLAGEQRYKTSLAPAGGASLHWLVLRRAGSVAAWRAGRWAAVKRLGARLRADTARAGPRGRP